MEAISKFLKMITFPELIKGLSITTKYLFQRKVTEQYPDERPVLPYRHKGKLHVTMETCISCRLCEKACPEGCIKVYPPPKEQMKTDKRPSEFYLNQEHCLHCSLCVDACPTGAIHHSDEYEMVVIDYKELLFDKEALPYDSYKKRYKWNFIESVPKKPAMTSKKPEAAPPPAKEEEISQ